MFAGPVVGWSGRGAARLAREPQARAGRCARKLNRGRAGRPNAGALDRRGRGRRVVRYLVDEWLEGLDVPSPAHAGGDGRELVAVIAGIIGRETPPARWAEFKRLGASRRKSTYVAAHLSSGSGSGRYQFWSAALDAFEAHPVDGIGAGGYEAYWDRHGHSRCRCATLTRCSSRRMAELGLVGLLLCSASSGPRSSRGRAGLQPAPPAPCWAPRWRCPHQRGWSRPRSTGRGSCPPASAWSCWPVGCSPDQPRSSVEAAPSARLEGVNGSRTPSPARPPTGARHGDAARRRGASIWAGGILFLTEVRLGNSREEASAGNLEGRRPGRPRRDHDRALGRGPPAAAGARGGARGRPASRQIESSPKRSTALPTTGSSGSCGRGWTSSPGTSMAPAVRSSARVSSTREHRSYRSDRALRPPGRRPARGSIDPAARARPGGRAGRRGDRGGSVLGRLAMDPHRAVGGHDAASVRPFDHSGEAGWIRASDLVCGRVSHPLGRSTRVRPLPAALHLRGAIDLAHVHQDAGRRVAGGSGIRDRLPPAGRRLARVAHSAAA